MKSEIVEFLACPVSGTPLELHIDEQHDDEIISGSLTTPDREHTYPIVRGIPRLLVDFSEDEDKVKTQSSFSTKWDHIPNFGFDGATRQHFLDWYLDRQGFGDQNGIIEFLKTRRFILDAGTGVGRDASFFGECAPHATVFGIDLSSSVEHAYKNTLDYPGVHILQADLTRLPFRHDFFDYLSCDQVLHHTPNTHESFKKLIPFVAPEGQLAIYVYRVKAPIREFCDDMLREHYTEAPEAEVYEFSEAMTLLGKALSELNVKIKIEKPIPLLGFEAGEFDLQRWIYYNMFKCYWNENFSMETNIAVNFDWYHPRHAFRHTEEEVRSWFAEAGFEMINFSVVPAGISARGRRYS